MDDELPPADETARFAALREESLALIEATKGLVAEMRTLLDDCKRRRPAVRHADSPSPAAPATVPKSLPPKAEELPPAPHQSAALVAG